MGPTLNVLYVALAGTASLIAAAVYACLVAAGRANQRAARIPVPVTSRARRSGGDTDRIRN